MSHLLKAMSTYAQQKKGLLSTGYQSYGILISLIKKTGYVTSRSCVSTTVWMHYLDINDTHRVKARWKLRKNASCSLEKSWKQQNSCCTATYLNHPSKTNKTCWWSKDELISDVLSWTSTHRRTSIDWPARTWMHQLCVDTECCQEDLPGTMDGWRERERERESHRNPCYQHDWIMPMMLSDCIPTGWLF